MRRDVQDFEMLFFEQAYHCHEIELRLSVVARVSALCSRLFRLILVTTNTTTPGLLFPSHRRCSQ